MFFNRVSKIVVSFLFILFCHKQYYAQNGLSVSSVDSMFKLAEKSSVTIKTGYQQSLSAKWTKIAAIGNTINIKSPLTVSWIDNTQLPVSYLPAQAFGGPEGTLKQVVMGQEYVTNYAVTPQIDIINPSSWARVKSAELNKQLTEVNNLVAKKNLFESISASYYNIISLQEQKRILEMNVASSDSILTIVTNKFKQGIVREQDLNNVTINLLNVKDKLNQVVLSLEQNYNSLKILCDIKPENPLIISEQVAYSVSEAVIAKSSGLIERQFQAQASYLKSELNANRLTSFSPVVSVVFNQNWQRNSNVSFSDAAASKFSSQYVGLKVSVPFPFDVNRLSTNYTNKINYTIASLNADHAALQNQFAGKQLDLDYQKAYSTYNTAKLVTELKNSNYRKSINQYNEGIISTEALLSYFTDKINAELNYGAAYSLLKNAETKIKINNTLQ